MMFPSTHSMMSASASFAGAACASSSDFILVILGAILLASILIALPVLAGIVLPVLSVLSVRVFAAPLRRQSHP